MIGGMGSAVTPDLSKGGTIDGDITITGDFKVEGGGSFTYDEIVEGKMHVDQGGSYGAGDGISFGADGLSDITMHLGGGNQFFITSGTSNIQIDRSSHIYFDTNGSERMRITSAGLVGINTTSPDAPLHIKSKTTDWDGSIVLEENDDGTANMITRNSDNLWFGYAPAASDVTSSPVMLMVMKENGNIGIGTDSPTAIHHVHNSGAATGWTHYTNTSTGTTANDGTHIGTNGTDAYIWNRISAL